MRKVFYYQVARLIIGFLIATLIMAQFGQLVVAQQATESAAIASPSAVMEESPTASPTPLPDLSPVVEPATPAASLTPTMEATASAVPSATASATLEPESGVDEFLDAQDILLRLTGTPSPTPADSAQIRTKPIFEKLFKQLYAAAEPITIVVHDVAAADVSLVVFDSSGQPANAATRIVSTSDPYVARVYLSRQLRPGRYRVVVKSGGDTVGAQDFSWGVLAINTNKSIYKPGETGSIAIAVLNDAGHMVCDARVSLRLSRNGQEVAVLSTNDGTIRVNPACARREYTGQADYETSYKFEGVGVYELGLSATTADGTRTLVDRVEVRESIPFDIERTSATRLYPPVTYTMAIDVTAGADFTGEIKETLPLGVAVHPLEGTPTFTQVMETETADTWQDRERVSLSGLVLPFDENHPISLQFGEQLRDPYLKGFYQRYGLLGHDGIDFDMAIGTPVLAVDDGVVVKATANGDYGTTVVLRHKWGKSYYGHLSEITAQLSDTVSKGFPLGLSGNTGLTTGAHLHLGIKPNANDIQNGYYGKIDPLPYLTLKPGNQDVLGKQTETVAVSETGSSGGRQVLTWKVSLAPGQKMRLGYRYQVPNVSPQFYTVGPLTVRNESGGEVFREARSWQWAVDADGSGTNTVNPTTATASSTGNTFTFTFTAAESMDSGEVAITVPTSSGWSIPQGTSGTAGYTTGSTSGNATIGNVIEGFNGGSWEEDDYDSCSVAADGVIGLALDTVNKQEGDASVTCNNTGNTTSDNADSWGVDWGTPKDLSGYTQLTFYIKVSADLAASSLQAAIDDNASCASPIEEYTIGAVTAAGGFTLQTWTFTGAGSTRTSVKTFCINSNAAGGMDSKQFWIDDVKVGGDVLSDADLVVGVNDNDVCRTATNSEQGVSLDTTNYKESPSAAMCDNAADTVADAGDSFGVKFAPAQDWQNYTQAGFWVRSSVNTSAGDFQAAIDDNQSCASPIEEYNASALTANVWSYQKWTFSGAGSTRTAVATFCLNAGTATAFDSKQIWLDEVLAGPGSLSFVTNGSNKDIRARFVDMANTETMTVTYGSGGGSSGVTAPSATGTYTFTTKSRIDAGGTLTAIGSSPTIEVTSGGPTNDQLLRHGGWFNASGVEQPFTF